MSVNAYVASSILFLYISLADCGTGRLTPFISFLGYGNYAAIEYMLRKGFDLKKEFKSFDGYRMHLPTESAKQILAHYEKNSNLDFYNLIYTNKDGVIEKFIDLLPKHVSAKKYIQLWVKSNTVRLNNDYKVELLNDPIELKTEVIRKRRNSEQTFESITTEMSIPDTQIVSYNPIKPVKNKSKNNKNNKQKSITLTLTDKQIERELKQKAQADEVDKKKREAEAHKIEWQKRQAEEKESQRRQAEEKAKLLAIQSQYEEKKVN